MVTHDPAATRYADRVLALADGRVVRDEHTTPDDTPGGGGERPVVRDRPGLPGGRTPAQAGPVRGHRAVAADRRVRGLRGRHGPADRHRDRRRPVPRHPDAVSLVVTPKDAADIGEAGPGRDQEDARGDRGRRPGRRGHPGRRQRRRTLPRPRRGPRRRSPRAGPAGRRRLPLRPAPDRRRHPRRRGVRTRPRIDAHPAAPRARRREHQARPGRDHRHRPLRRLRGRGTHRVRARPRPPEAARHAGLLPRRRPHRPARRGHGGGGTDPAGGARSGRTVRGRGARRGGPRGRRGRERHPGAGRRVPRRRGRRGRARRHLHLPHRLRPPRTAVGAAARHRRHVEAARGGPRRRGRGGRPAGRRGRACSPPGAAHTSSPGRRAGSGTTCPPPPRSRRAQTALTVLGTGLLAVLAVLAPSLTASRVSPLQALRTATSGRAR